jgi:hypothetical protein
MAQNLLEYQFTIFGILFIILFALITFNINRLEKSGYFVGVNLHLFWNYLKVCWSNIETVENTNVRRLLKNGRILNNLLLVGVVLFILTYFLILNFANDL